MNRHGSYIRVPIKQPKEQHNLTASLWTSCHTKQLHNSLKFFPECLIQTVLSYTNTDFSWNSTISKLSQTSPYFHKIPRTNQFLFEKTTDGIACIVCCVLYLFVIATLGFLLPLRRNIPCRFLPRRVLWII